MDNQAKKIPAGLNKSLEGWTLRPMLEISHTDDDGKKTEVIGLSPNLDKEFANAFVNGPGPYRFDEVMVLVNPNGEHGYVLRDGNGISILTEKGMKDQVREHALKQLSPAQRKVLGL